MNITAYLLSCPERENIREQTLRDLAATDWNDDARIEIDRTTFEQPQERQEQTALTLLRRAIQDAPDFILFLEDDLQFNRHLRYNLKHWHPLNQVQADGHFFASLYNPNVRELEQHTDLAYFVADPNCVYGSQCFVLSLATARYMEAHWAEVPGMQDIKMSRLAARLGPIYYHVPSLVQHTGVTSVWGGHYHYARDFLSEWRAPVNKKIIVVTFHDDRFVQIGALSVPNKASYAAQHGYAFVSERVALSAPRSPYWAKIPVLLRHLPYYDWAFWTDADSLIMNGGVSLESLVDEDFDLIITKDHNGLNSGQFLIKNSQWSLGFLEEVYAEEQFVNHPSPEQAAMAHVLERGETHGQHIKYLGQNALNSYVHNYRRGDFLIHFAGLGRDLPTLESTMREWSLRPESSLPEAQRSAIVAQVQAIDGWLDDAEADLLIRITTRIAASLAPGSTAPIVEVGSYCGKSSIVFALTLKALGLSTIRLYAIDPHQGDISVLGGGVTRMAPTYEKFTRNVHEAGVSSYIEPVQAHSVEVPWNRPIALLFLDGLHDYESVSADFYHFADWIMPGGLVAFHDCADHFPGVKRLVNELLNRGDHCLLEQVKDLAVLEKR